ncbi:hypothetical protein GCM10008018_22970 [Paenibacillus marchantiophytorum]|uniref:DUF4083 domain-containing protein n=1 Tax=Paenibacillus marchantiophytorum TaxID=1619310 RepID=A0ABQ1ELU5_9BACL|nr:MULTISPECIES: hypothetical protein [Paenibacillus]UKS27485.1 hypothetical protein LOZ80_00595 [Paenibacillus sp. HWE-109]GFZ76879.1 hypothetical protein GCM10008018_22970 [Paenibacillus marchantiophytorum]
MDTYVIVLLACVAIFLIFRLRQAFRKTRGRIDKTEEIEQRLAQLRKKRDED